MEQMGQTIDENKHELIGMYAIWDKKGLRYDTPFFCHSDLFAQRRFYLIAKDPNSILHNFITDFELCHLADINIISGEIHIPELKVVMEGIQIASKLNSDKGED